MREGHRERGRHTYIDCNVRRANTDEETLETERGERNTEKPTECHTTTDSPGPVDPSIGTIKPLCAVTHRDAAGPESIALGPGLLTTYDSYIIATAAFYLITRHTDSALVGRQCPVSPSLDARQRGQNARKRANRQVYTAVMATSRSSGGVT